MDDEEKQFIIGDGVRQENVFEQNAGRVGEKKTVPLRLGDRIVGNATVEVDEVGIRVVATDVTDPDMIKMLSAYEAGINIGPLPIFYHGGKKE
jgi:hypothetical protein